MNVRKRSAQITLATGEIATVDIIIDHFAKLSIIDTAFLTRTTVTSTPNQELTTASAILLTDPKMVNRYQLMSTNIVPHNGLELQVYHDTKYSDIIVIPTMELYASITYINGSNIEIGAYGVNFTGDHNGKLPPVNSLYDIKCVVAKIANYKVSHTKNSYYEADVVPALRVSTPSMFPMTLLDFGNAITMFTTPTAIVDINVISYNSLFERANRYLGRQKLNGTSGNIVLELPL